MSRCGSLMRAFFQTSPEDSACRVAWRRGSRLHARNRAAVGARRGSFSDVAEAVDLLLEPGPLLAVADAQACLGGEGEDADLAGVGVVLHVAGGLADVV